MEQNKIEQKVKIWSAKKIIKIIVWVIVGLFIIGVLARIPHVIDNIVKTAVATGNLVVNAG